MNSCSESKHVETKFNVILNATAGRKGNCYTRRKILIAQRDQLLILNWLMTEPHQTWFQW